MVDSNKKSCLTCVSSLCLFDYDTGKFVRQCLQYDNIIKDGLTHDPKKYGDNNVCDNYVPDRNVILSNCQ